MALSETRREILELIADEKVTRVKDLEDSLQLNRSGILRHLTESQNENWITKEKVGTQTSLEITRKGLEELGRMDITGQIENYIYSKEICSRILLEILKYPVGINYNIFLESINKQFNINKNAINKYIINLIHHHLVIDINGTLTISNFTTVFLIENDDFHDALINYFARLTELSKKHIENRLKEKDIEISITPDTDKLLFLYITSFKQTKEKIANHLFHEKIALIDIMTDESVFKIIDKIIKKDISSTTFEYFFGIIGQNVVNKYEPDLIRQL